MSSAMYDEVLSHIREAELVRVCRDLVRLQTVNPPGDEQPAAEYVADFLRETGFDVEVVRHAENRASTLCRLKGRGDVGALVFNGHLDTVSVGAQPWEHPPFDAEVAEGRIWGRGASDMKGGVAAMMVAAKAVAEAGVELAGDLLFAATAGEEVNMLGAKELAAREDLGPLEAIIISEPTYGRVGLAERGVLWVELTTHGRTAHGATPELGRNAIRMMMALLAALDGLEVPYRPHAILGDFTHSVNTIQGGAQTNVVPDRCVATVDMRTVPGQEHEAILRQLDGLIADLSSQIPEFSASVRAIYNLPAVETPPDVLPVVRFMEAVEEVTGKNAEIESVRFATEAAIFVPAFVTPTIIFGPGDPNLAHQPDEHVEIAKLVEAAQVYALAALDLLA